MPNLLGRLPTLVAPFLQKLLNLHHPRNQWRALFRVRPALARFLSNPLSLAVLFLQRLLGQPPKQRRALFRVRRAQER